MSDRLGTTTTAIPHYRLQAGWYIVAACEGQPPELRRIAKVWPGSDETMVAFSDGACMMARGDHRAGSSIARDNDEIASIAARI